MHGVGVGTAIADRCQIWRGGDCRSLRPPARQHRCHLGSFPVGPWRRISNTLRRCRHCTSYVWLLYGIELNSKSAPIAIVPPAAGLWSALHKLYSAIMIFLFALEFTRHAQDEVTFDALPRIGCSCCPRVTGTPNPRFSSTPVNSPDVLPATSAASWSLGGGHFTAFGPLPRAAGNEPLPESLETPHLSHSVGRFDKQPPSLRTSSGEPEASFLGPDGLHDTVHGGLQRSDANLELAA
jgi:hypothetical protein